MGSIRFDRIADRYDETRGGEGRADRFAEHLAPLLDTGGLVLDLGIGTGIVARALARRGFRVGGVDLSEAMLSRARDRLGPVVSCADAARLPIATGALPQVVSCWLLHLVDDVPAVLREVGRALAPGGRYLVVPGTWGSYGDSASDRAVRRMHEALDDDRERRARVTPEALDAAARGTGLRLAQVVAMPTFRYTVTVAHEIERIETRAYSSLWDLDDATWERVVEPTLAVLREVPDAEVERANDDMVVVLEREGR